MISYIYQTMRLSLFHLCIFVFFANQLPAQAPGSSGQDGVVMNIAGETKVMSEAYWKLWNPEVQARIDRDIEKYRKADAVLKLEGLVAGTLVKVEQTSHDFIFGANMFNFNQLGTSELNQKYKELFGVLFNSATIPFYWKKFEMQPNRLRFHEEYWDTEEYWNAVEAPKHEPYWRRPASDPIVEFCESKSIRTHGHPMI